MVFNLCESRSQSCVGGGAAAVVELAEQEYLSRRHLASGQETLCWNEKTGKDWQLRVRNLGRHLKGMQ